jgi:hypothetical protein
MRTIWAAAMLAAVCFFVPSGALAHADHSNHATAEVSRADGHAAMSVAIEALAIKAVAKSFRPQAEVGIVNNEPHTGACLSQCCAASSMICCVAGLVSLPQILAPPDRSPGRIPNSCVWSGLIPEVLPKPPRAVIRESTS